jgi:hypothetical protein
MEPTQLRALTVILRCALLRASKDDGPRRPSRLAREARSHLRTTARVWSGQA